MTAATPIAHNPVYANTNSVVVLGAIARDVKIRDVPNSTNKVVLVTVAGEEITTDEQGKPRRLAFYEQAVFRGKSADQAIALNLKPGDAVVMDGKFVRSIFTDKNGVEHKELEIKYSGVRKAIGFAAAERTKDAGGAIRLVGGFAKATVYGKVVGKGGELRYTPTGRAVFNFSVNARSAWKDASGTWQSDAAFVKATIWGDLGVELAELSIAKDMEALIEGRPTRSKGKDKDGNDAYYLDVTATRVIIAEGVDSRSGGSYAGGGGLDALPPQDFFGADDVDDGVTEEDLPF